MYCIPVCVRVKPETVDYSTQYSWMFGVLSVIIATGVHPLSDYPSKYEENHRIRYRSHHVQSLPDSSKVCVCIGWLTQCKYIYVNTRYTFLDLCVL